MTTKYDYVLMTPCKNEEKSLPKFSESIINQTITPKLWLIINDSSTDKSSEILSDLERKHNWIRVITTEGTKRDLSFHYAKVVSDGFSLILQISCKEKISFEYLGLIDADMILENNFFEKIIDRFEKNPRLGIASGNAVYYNGDKLVAEEGRENLPIGGLRVWRKNCFIETGGFPISYSADSVSNVLAILRGWDTKKFDDIIGVQTRRTSSAEGLWKGYRTKGESDYYRDYHPLYVIFKFVKYSLTSPSYIGLAYLDGYIRGIIKIRKKIDIPEVRKYYRNKHLEVGRYYAGKFKFRL
ncbi:glycosyl transferase [Methanosarcina mazei]|uniref:Glycosyl transferase n=1 Tax=Methanosarcina mazei TaxID=2209 RepID=A0A0F8EGB9_METMZ|nr:glycosyltransferase family 2 protein [Methanosarcina mazei]KKG29194.1 glycosyl transferase [Methanosarcina mazei]KKG40423.1 glycosyl transferase [Methanosarcina mazei]KKG40748.1 glycosyl transferase [Methanosarcina mazei]KKG43346.1 glycosyl transferase [Methanosarcina mazei]KKG53487.1 glycosyl transferase [Methanosarcina mazei]